MTRRVDTIAQRIVAGVAVISAAACSRTNPAAPSTSVDASRGAFAIVATPAPPPSVTWSCMTTPGCGAPGANAAARTTVAPAAPATPSNLSASVSGSTVTLTWSAAGGATSYRVEAGAAPGGTELANFDTGHTTPSLIATGVPDGTYYVRVRAQNIDGRSDPSNEIVLTVGTALCTPSAPTGLASTVTGTSVALNWTAPSGTCAPTTYEIDAGSSSGSSNLTTYLTGTTSTSFSASSIAPGTYYVRVRAAHGALFSASSNEVVAVIGTTASSVTGRWVGLSPDGWFIDASTGSCDTSEDIQLDLTQTGSSISGTLTERIRAISPTRPGCDTVGAVYGPWQLTGTVGPGTITFVATFEKGRSFTFSGTFTSTRMATSVAELGSTLNSLTVNKQ